MKRAYLYRVVVTEWPAGGQPEYSTFPADPDWKPEGWTADAEWRERFHTADFFWPSNGREYKSRSGAKARADLFEKYGAKTVIQRSNPITWPDDEAAA